MYLTRPASHAIAGPLGLLALSLAYCLPRHPSAGSRLALDVALHMALFAVVGGWFGLARRPLRGRMAVFAGLALLAVLLELLQWQLGGYARMEWGDALANVAGLGIGWRVATLGSVAPPK